MDRLWRFLKGLFGRRMDVTSERDPHLVCKFGPSDDYSTEVWLDGHRWEYDETHKQWMNTNYKERW